MCFFRLTDGLARGSPARLSHELPLPPMRADPSENPHPQRQQRGHHPDEGPAAVGPQEKTHRRPGSQGSALCKHSDLRKLTVYGGTLSCGVPSGPALPLLPGGSDPGASSSESGGPGQVAGFKADLREEAVLIGFQKFRRLWQISTAAAPPSATSANLATPEREQTKRPGCEFFSSGHGFVFDNVKTEFFFSIVAESCTHW